MVDDEPHVRADVRPRLTAAGLPQVGEAGSVAEGLALDGEHRPSVALPDGNRPVMPGDIRLARLWVVAPAAAVSVMTAENNHGIGPFSQQAGAIGDGASAGRASRWPRRSARGGTAGAGGARHPDGDGRDRPKRRPSPPGIAAGWSRTT